MSAALEIDLLVAICEDYFKQRNYAVKKSCPLHQHIRWRPHIFAEKSGDKIALDVRLTDSIPKFFRDILKDARRLLPNLKIYMAIPAEAKSIDIYVKQTKSTGIGLFIIDGTILQQKVKPKKSRGKNYVSTPSGKRTQTIILRSGSRYAAWIELGQVLASANQYAKLIDPYCDEKTLGHLLHVKQNVEIKLITAFSGSRQPQERVFKVACQQFKMDHPKFLARKCDPRTIHDRYYITEKQTWMLGSSVKDVGLKFGCLARIEDVQAVTEIEQFFEGIWNDPNSIMIV